MKIRFLPFFSLFIFGLFSVLNASEQLYLSILTWKDDQVVRISQPVELEEDETLLRVGISEQLSESAVAEEGLEPFFGEGAVLKSFEVRNEKGIGIIEAPSLRESFVDNEEIRKRFAWLLDEWIQFSIGIESAEIRLVNDSGLDLLIESETLLPVSKPEVDEPEISERQVANVPHAPAQGTAQPTGALSDASIFLSPGHGWHYSSGRWRTQRGVTNQIIEDLNTAESVLQYLHQYLWNAGARIYTTRERDLNTNMVIVNQGNSGYSQTGSWAVESASRAHGGSHRVATTTTGEPTATARFTPDIPEAGHYAVYVWYRTAASGVTTADARITVNHSGDSTLWVQNQNRDGFTWKYIGTYYFEKGSNPETGSVVIDNKSSAAGRRVIAGAVRFGGGMGDVKDDVSGTISGRPRWEESGRYYAAFLGKSDWASANEVWAMPQWAAWEHESWEDGKSIYLAWHTNAGGGTGTETFAYSSHRGSGPFNGVPGGLELRKFVHNQVIRDIRSGWDSNWRDRGQKLDWFGEINPNNNPKMPAALIEMAFHDHAEDAKYLLDPEFRRDTARAVYKGLVQYYANEVPGFNNATYLPEPPQELQVSAKSDGSVELNWKAPLFSTGPTGFYGHAATGYRVYRSKNGYGFDNGTAVSGASATLSGFAPGETVFLRVSATNAGGESFPTSTLAVRIPDEREKKLLIVNGFTRNDRFMNLVEADPQTGQLIQRGYVNRLNSYDYVIEHARAIEAYPELVGFDSAEVAAIESGAVSLSDYDAVIWMAGLQADVNDIKTSDTPVFKTSDTPVFTSGLVSKLTQYLNQKGQLFLSGAHVASDLDRMGMSGWRRAILKTDLVKSDSAVSLEGLSGSILDSWEGSLGGRGYLLDKLDEVEPVEGSEAAAVYVGTKTNVVEGFETPGSWWQPEGSGSTRGEGTFSIVGNPVYNGSGAAKLTYDFAKGDFLRFHNPAKTPFPADSNLSLWVYGDNSGHRFRVSVQDSDNDLFANAYVTLDFSGWREIIWEDIRNNYTKWAGTGDGVVTGSNVGLESLQIQESAGGPKTGTIYVDYLVASPVSSEGESEERIAGIEFDDRYRLFYLAAPFEKIGRESERNHLMNRVLDFFEFDLTPFEGWLREVFSEAELDDPEISGEFANPSGDGIPNLLKYALGLDPNLAGREGLPKAEIEGEALVLRYDRAKRAGDVDFIVEISDDLVSWRSGDEEIEIVEIVDQGEVERVTVRDKTSFPENGRRFMRLRVERAE